MLFFFKQKPIEITAILPAEYNIVNELNPIKPAKECFPSWWKNTASSKFNWDLFKARVSVKSCPGIGLSLQRGFILHQWSDLAIETLGEDWRWLYSDKKTTLSHHSNLQAPEFYSDHHIFKIECPWRIISPVDIFVQFPVYLFNTPPPYVTPSGFVPPLNNSAQINPFLMFKKSSQGQQCMIKQGTPLLQIIPFTDKKVKIKCEVVTKEEYIKINSNTSYRPYFSASGLKRSHKVINK